ncbi:MAG: hypothetical protein FJ146_04970 [Deltaproteobacteria bacterium]|nr:hypothetical protein [Deltaproteobacteria bacterium]
MERVKKPRRSTSVAARKDTSEAPVSEQPTVDPDQLADEQAVALAQGAPLVPRDLTLTVKLSRQLHSKLLHSAQDEGVPLEALVQELLAEGATLRAWEIIERKSAMRGQASPNSSNNGNGGHRNFNAQFSNPRHGQGGGRNGAHGGGRPGGGNGRGQGGGRLQTGTAWMDDKAAFLEYVRNQEKRRR